jgi:hypothetical protein
VVVRSTFPLQEALRQLGVLSGRGAQRTLLQLCHAGRLRGGLSVALGALPDEVIGALTHAMGGAAARLRVCDVRTSSPMVIEVQAGEVREKWELEDVNALVHNLNDLYREDPGVRVVAVLGEWQDMTQLWSLERPLLRQLLDARLLDESPNLVMLVRTFHATE